MKRLRQVYNSPLFGILIVWVMHTDDAVFQNPLAANGMRWQLHKTWLKPVNQLTTYLLCAEIQPQVWGRLHGRFSTQVKKIQMLECWLRGQLPTTCLVHYLLGSNDATLQATKARSWEEVKALIYCTSFLKRHYSEKTL